MTFPNSLGQAEPGRSLGGFCGLAKGSRVEGSGLPWDPPQKSYTNGAAKLVSTLVIHIHIYIYIYIYIYIHIHIYIHIYIVLNHPSGGWIVQKCCERLDFVSSPGALRCQRRTWTGPQESGTSFGFNVWGFLKWGYLKSSQIRPCSCFNHSFGVPLLFYRTPPYNYR